MERKHEAPEDRGIPTQRREAGRLVENGSGTIDEEKDMVADAAEDELEGRSAEEIAVRIEEEEPNGVTNGPDSYLESEQDRAG